MPKLCLSRILLASAVLITGLRAQAEDAQRLPDRELSAPAEDDRPLIALTYSMALPARSLRAELDDTSYSGFEYAVLVPLVAGWHVGAAASYNRFDDSDGRRTYDSPGVSLTGTYYRRLTTVSVTAINRYYLMDADRPFRIYGGVRVGVAFADAARWVVDRGRLDSLSGFQLAPEAGISLRLSPWLDLVAGYEFVFVSSSFGRSDFITFHAIQLGPQLRY